MRSLTAKELRQLYLDFFRSKGHAVISSASLIPENDPTVLFTTAGMHPLVPYLMGEKHPEGKRLCDVQKCVRTGDIEREEHQLQQELGAHRSIELNWRIGAGLPEEESFE